MLNGETLFAFCSIFATPIDNSIPRCYTYNAVTIVASIAYRIEPVKGDIGMTLTQKRLLSLLAVILVAAVLGRLAVRAVLNLLVGGTLFGGNFL